VAKAKTNSQNIKRYVSRLRDDGSILIVLSQTRDKVNSFIPNQKTRAGGKALRFYAHVEVWTSVVGRLTKKYQGKELVNGTLIQMEVQKNRQSGWEATKITVPFYKGHGFDDVGGCIDFLVDWRHWATSAKEDEDVPPKKGRKGPRKKAGGTIVAPEFSFTGTRDALAVKIQEDGDERELRLLVQEVWDEIEAACAVKRKPRYE
jgi:hypothetical protein